MELEINSFTNLPELGTDTAMISALDQAVESLNAEMQRINSALQSATSPEDYESLLNARQLAQEALDTGNISRIKDALQRMQAVTL